MIRNGPTREPHAASTPAPTLRAAVSQVAVAPASSLKRREGEPLDAAVRVAAEHVLGHDFSKVRVHCNDDAAQSAEQLGALAFTVGSAIAFAPGRYVPATPEGRDLLLHELGHVAERSGAVGFQLDPVALPGFDQGEYGSCGAASIVTALVLWDRERHDPTAPNTLVVTACDIALVYMDDNQDELKRTWEASHPGKGEQLYQDAFHSLTLVRDRARAPGAQLTQEQYEQVGLVFYALYLGGGVGLPRQAREALLDLIGLRTEAGNDVASFDDIFASDILTNLAPGRVAQVTWYVVLGPSKEPGEVSLGSHAFLIGRFKDRDVWFLSDQGASPAVELEAPDLATLKQQALATDRYWTGAPPDRVVMVNYRLPVPPGTTQVMLLGERGGVEEKAKTLVLGPRELLAEVDAGLLAPGSLIRAGDFVARAYSEADGMKALLAIPAGKGGVMVENPVGLFHVYETTTVDDKNLNVTGIDEGFFSAGGRLDPASKQYHSAWLRLCSATACNPKPLKVY